VPQPETIEVRFLKPQELKRADGLRGVAFAKLNRELIVIPLNEGETWTTYPEGGILVIHPLRKPVWCRIGDDHRYVRSVLEIN
jgi:hypothetical protein